MNFIDRFIHRPLTIKIFIALEIILFIAFFTVPFLTVQIPLVNFSHSFTAFNLPIDFLRVVREASGQLQAYKGSVILFTICLFLPYAVPIMAVITCVIAGLRQKNRSIVIFFTESFVVDLVIAVIALLVRSFLVNLLVDAIKSYGNGENLFLNYGINLVTDQIKQISSFGIFYYLLWIIGIAGIAIRYIRKYLKKYQPETFNRFKNRNQQTGGAPFYPDNQAGNYPPPYSEPQEQPPPYRPGRVDNYPPPNNYPVNGYNEPAPNLPVLVLVGNPELRIYDLPNVIGRGNDVDTYLNNKSVSRTHLQVTQYNDVLLVTDMNSAGGSKINGRPLIPNKKYRLNNGDILSIGQNSFKARINEKALRSPRVF